MIFNRNIEEAQNFFGGQLGDFFEIQNFFLRDGTIRWGYNKIEYGIFLDIFILISADKIYQIIYIFNFLNNF